MIRSARFLACALRNETMRIFQWGNGGSTASLPGKIEIRKGKDAALK
jgi:hypothetical protein